jgi:hypothetical protein
MHPPQTSTTTCTTKHRRSQTRICQWLKIIQHQMGHDHASTTSIYTCVSSDFRVRTLRRALDTTITDALSLGDEETS